MNKWTKKQWLKVLKIFNIVEHREFKAKDTISDLDEFQFVIKR